MNLSNNTTIKKLGEAWEENPLVVIAIAVGAAATLSKLIDSVSSIPSKRAYARQINQKAAKQK